MHDQRACQAEDSAFTTRVGIPTAPEKTDRDRPELQLSLYFEYSRSSTVYTMHTA